MNIIHEYHYKKTWRKCVQIHIKFIISVMMLAATFQMLAEFSVHLYADTMFSDLLWSSWLTKCLPLPLIAFPVPSHTCMCTHTWRRRYVLLLSARLPFLSRLIWATHFQHLESSSTLVGSTGSPVKHQILIP